MAQYEDIVQKINQGLSDKLLKRWAKDVQQFLKFRKGLFKFEEQEKLPARMKPLKLGRIVKDIALKHPLTLIWEDSASQLTSYSNFIKYLYKKYLYLKTGEYTHRSFNPGERC
ncbi:MAG: hypothetical protein ACXVCY_03560 [Pseudobdellovibrionaceae bacterium]